MKNIQSFWRGVLRLDQLRKTIVKNQWKELQKELVIKYYKSKNQKAVAAKLRNVTDKMITKAVGEYYRESKLAYLAELRKYHRQEKAADAPAEQKPMPIKSNLAPTTRKNESIGKSGCNAATVKEIRKLEAPTFKYKPEANDLTKLILSLIS